MTVRANQRLVVKINPYTVTWPFTLESNVEVRFGNRTIYNPGTGSVFVNADYSISLKEGQKPQKIQVGESK